jgi:hypothetical protein
MGYAWSCPNAAASPTTINLYASVHFNPALPAFIEFPASFNTTCTASARFNKPPDGQPVEFDQKPLLFFVSLSLPKAIIRTGIR